MISKINHCTSRYISTGIFFVLFSIFPFITHAQVTFTPPSPAQVTSPSPTQVTSPSPTQVTSPSPTQVTSPSPTQVTSPYPSQTTGSCSGGTGILCNPLNASSLQQLIQEIINVIVVLGSMFLTIMLIYVGYLFVSARGNQEKITQARTALLWTVIGGLLLLGASAIATAITNTAQSL